MSIEQTIVSKNDTLEKTMKVIDNNGIGIALVVEKETLVGVLTDSDIRRALLNGIRLDTRADVVMNTKPILLKKGYTSVDVKNIVSSVDVAKFPVNANIQVPVINESGKPIDIVYVSKQGRVITPIKPVDGRIKRVLLVGGGGYLGGILSELLIKKGYHVRVFDNLMYGDSGIKHVYHSSHFEFHYGDMRNMKHLVRAVRDVDAVIHLAAIVGDPASALNPEETIESNYLATKSLAEICKYAQINRFIFASTASVYGASDGKKELTETSPLNPVSLYADMKMISEQALLEISEGNFSPTIFRMGTLFGLSQRMRFDLVINLLSIQGIVDGKFTIFGGDQYRAFCHVKDAAFAYLKCLELPIDVVGNQIFNVVTHNATINQVGEIISNITGGKAIIDDKATDKRNYAVSPKKINKIITFEEKHGIEYGVNEIMRYKKRFFDYKHEKYSNYNFLRGK